MSEIVVTRQVVSSNKDRQPYPMPTLRQSMLKAGGYLLLILLFVWALSGSDIDLEKTVTGIPRLGDFFGRLFPPNVDVATTVFQATLETLQIALAGTFLSIFASIIFGVLGASNLTPEWVHQPIKWMLGALRGIPLILLALMFVTVVGLGPYPGVLAIAFHSTGMLGKFYAEAFENARRGPIEALDSAGASWLQRIRFGMLPQVAPDLARDTLFRFELNFRDSLVLGLVGAGGIGFYIQLYTRGFQYDRVATLTIIVLLMVIVIEQMSVSIRRHLR